MTRQRAALYVLLGIVAAAAAVLSFSALRDLALLCGFAPALAWLLPVTVDAGAAAGSLVWLARWTSAPATRFARALALTLLTLSVAANAVGHGLEAFRISPAWWVVVIVSAVAPAVLGAVVHLAVLVGRPVVGDREERAGETATPAGTPAGEEPGDEREEPPAHVALHLAPTPGDEAGEPVATPPARAEDLIAAGAGRRKLAQELGVTEYEARQLIDAHRGVGG